MLVTRADPPAAAQGRADRAPDRRPVPLGSSGDLDRRLGQRPAGRHPGSEHPHPGEQGRDVRHPAGTPSARAGAAGVPVRSTAGGPACSPAPSRWAAGHRWRPNDAGRRRRRRASGHDDGELGEPWAEGERSEEPAVRAAARRPGGGRLRARPPGAGRVLHRHLGLHRLQGLRGGLQGVEHAPDGRLGRDARRPRAVGDVLRQHRPARGEHLAARGLHRAGAHGRPADARRRPARGAAGDAGPGRRRAGARQPGQGAVERAQRGGAGGVRPADHALGRPGDPVADVLGRLQALHARRLPGRLPDRGAVPHASSAPSSSSRTSATAAATACPPARTG